MAVNLQGTQLIVRGGGCGMQTITSKTAGRKRYSIYQDLPNQQGLTDYKGEI